MQKQANASSVLHSLEHITVRRKTQTMLCYKTVTRVRGKHGSMCDFFFYSFKGKGWKYVYAELKFTAVVYLVKTVYGRIPRINTNTLTQIP